MAVGRGAPGQRGVDRRRAEHGRGLAHLPVQQRHGADHVRGVGLRGARRWDVRGNASGRVQQGPLGLRGPGPAHP
jgi:hypothetical protein